MTKPRRRVKRYAAMHREALESRIRAEREAMLRDLADELATALRMAYPHASPTISDEAMLQIAKALRRYDDSRRSIDA